MKKFRLTSYGAAAALMLLAGCDEGMYEGSGKGSISPLVSYDPTVVASRSASSRAAEFDEITVDDLTITLTSADGQFSQEYLYGNFPTDQVFAVGKYTMTASYGNNEEEGFEKPAVYGTADLTVTEGKNTPVELVAKPSKAMVGISYDASVTDYLSDLSATLHSAAGNTIAFPVDETRCAYIQPGHVTIDVTFTKPNGMGGTLQVADFEAKAQYRYNMNVKLGGDGSGEVSSITIMFNDDLAQESVDIDISDEILSVPAPVVTLTGVADGEVLNVVEGSSLSVTPRFTVNARGGVKTAVLTTTGTSLLEQGWPAEIDLANLTADQSQTLSKLGLKDMATFRNGSKMARVDFTGVVEHIPATMEGASPVMFALAVTDKNGKTSGAQPLGFGIKVDKLAITLSGVDGYAYAGESTVDVNVTYNGTEPLENLLTVKYLNGNGVFKPATIASVTPQSRASSTYLVKVNVPSDAQLPVTLKASAGSVETGEVVIPSAPAPELAVNVNDVFARNLWATVSSSSYDCSRKEIELYVSTDGVNFAKATGTQSGADYHITGGLNPATSYTLRAKVGALLSNTVTVTTEAATPIPGGNLDEGWSSEQKGSHQYITVPTPWSSLNPVTSGYGNSSETNKYAHVNGTVSTDDAVSGSAALLRACAYGFSGHSALVTNKTDKCLPGKLFLGEGQVGISFASRPSALKVQYKYLPYKSGETGYVEIEVLDAADNVLASGSRSLAEQGNYTTVSVPLTYQRNASKAAKLKVLFRSTDENIDGSYVKEPSKTLGVITDRYYGASLYIDDVELVY